MIVGHLRAFKENKDDRNSSLRDRRHLLLRDLAERPDRKDVKTIWGPGGEAMFIEHDDDHEHALNGTATTSWRNEPVNLPLTCVDVRLSMSGTRTAGGVGGILVGPDGATGVLGGGDPTTAGMKNVLMHSIASIAGDSTGVSVQGSIPIVTPATPAISYAGTTIDLLNFFMVVTGYHDRWAPKGF